MLVGHQHQDVRPCLSIYVDHAGIAPLEVIKWATRNGGALTGISVVTNRLQRCANALEVTAGLGDDKAAGDRQGLFSEAIGGDLRCPDRIEREVHARYGTVDNVRRIDAWRDLALRFGPMGWRPEQKHEDAKQKYKTRKTRHELLRCHGGYLHDARGEDRVNSPNASIRFVGHKARHPFG